MCLMCIEIIKERMTVKEARVALRELIETAEDSQDLEHYKELASASDEELVEIASENSSDNE